MKALRPAALLVAAPLLLAACGSESDEDQLTKIIKDGGKDPTTICAHLAPGVLRSFGGTVEACEKQAKAADDGKDEVTVDELTVEGAAATARITGAQGRQVITFAKQDGDWQVTKVS